MPTHREIRTAIGAKISAAQANTRVHLFERYLANLGALKEQYVDINAATLIGCHIRRVATQRQQTSVGRWMITHKWAIRFYRALDDESESELAFDDWVEAVAEAFRTDETLSGLIFETRPNDSTDTEGLQVEESGPVMFCGVLSHSAKCALFTTHLQ